MMQVSTIFQGGQDMYNSSVWQEYFYIFKLLWRSTLNAFNSLSRHKINNGYTRERGA